MRRAGGRRTARLLRPSLPVVVTPDPGRVSGIGDLTLFDLFVPRRFDWGSFGLGPVFVFPTATDSRMGAGKWQIGPAGALMFAGVRHLQLGVIVNPFSVAGDDDRDAVSQLLVQPILQYNLPRGWYVSMGDLNWSFDWKDGGAAEAKAPARPGAVRWRSRRGA